MRENTQEKSLVQVNENSIFYKIKKFFRNLFHRNEFIAETNMVQGYIDNTTEKENAKNSFMEAIRKIEDDETRLLKMQKQYHCGEIKEDELTEEQIVLLCSLYDKQIANLKKSNEMRKQKLLEYRRKLQTDG